MRFDVDHSNVSEIVDSNTDMPLHSVSRTISPTRKTVETIYRGADLNSIQKQKKGFVSGPATPPFIGTKKNAKDTSGIMRLPSSTC